MTTLRARAAVGVAALLLASVLTSCDDEEDPPEPLESPSEATSTPTSATTTPTPTGPVEPTLPAEAEAETKAGAEAFVDFYWDVVNFAQATGDVALLKSLSIEGCGGCNGGVESIEKIYRRGGQIFGGQFSLLDATTDRTPSGAWNVSARVKVSRRQVVDAGSENEESRPGVVDFLFGLSYQDRAWNVTFLDTA